MLPNLTDLLDYQHPRLINNYMRTLDAEESVAQGLFDDVLKYLWLSKKHAWEKENNPSDPALQFQFVMHEEMRPIDEMWHNFILYTRDYADFCNNFFGHFIHHEPDLAINSVQSEEDFFKDLEKYLNYVYENLGEATVKRWFSRHFSETDVQDAA